jgi:hypothetical protein
MTRAHCQMAKDKALNSRPSARFGDALRAMIFLKKRLTSIVSLHHVEDSRVFAPLLNVFNVKVVIRLREIGGHREELIFAVFLAECRNRRILRFVFANPLHILFPRQMLTARSRLLGGLRPIYGKMGGNYISSPFNPRS